MFHPVTPLPPLKSPNMPQSFGCRPFTAEAQVRTQASGCAIYGGKSGAGTISSFSTSVLQYFQYFSTSVSPCQCHFTSVL